jgi:hypothetical protein
VTEARLPVITIDGASIDDFAGFVDAFAEKLDDFEWHGSVASMRSTTSFAEVAGRQTVDSSCDCSILRAYVVPWAGQQRSAGWKGRW